MLFNGKVAYVKEVLPEEGKYKLMHIQTKRERIVEYPSDSVKLIESYGVNIFDFEKEPSYLKTCMYDWVVDLTVSSPLLLNTIHRRI